MQSEQTLLSTAVRSAQAGPDPPAHCNSGFCLGDYPHIGADANAVYFPTNEFVVTGPGFYGAQVYGIGNNVLSGGSGSVVLFDTLGGAGPDGTGFTVWPAAAIARTEGDRMKEA